MASTRSQALNSSRTVAKSATGTPAKGAIASAAKSKTVTSTGSPRKAVSAKPKLVPAIIAANSPSTTSPSPGSSPKKGKSKRVLYEDSLDHIAHSPQCELPPEFVAYHSAKFIEGVKHILSVDPSLYRPIVAKNFDRHKNQEDTSIKDANVTDSRQTIRQYWLNLISSVISQQISGKAAAAIYQRFEGLFESEPNPKELLTKLTEELREIGLSGQKAKYVTHICEVFSDPDENLTKLDFYKQSDLLEIIEELVKLKGIGEWTAKMFALFTLKEWDVFAHDDLGIARGAYYYLSKRPEIVKQVKQQVHSDETMKALLKKKGKFENSKGKRDWVPYHDQYLIQLSKRFSPYRSIFMIILYRLSDTTIDILEETGQ